MVNLGGFIENTTLEWPRVSHRITLNLPMASPVVKTHFSDLATVSYKEINNQTKILP